MDNFNLHMTSMLQSLSATAEGEGVAAVKTLVKEGVLSGVTLLLAVGLLERMDALWECALQLGPVMNRIARERAKGHKGDVVALTKSMRISIPRRDGKSLLPLLDDGIGSPRDYTLPEYVEAIEADFSAASVTLERLLSASGNLEVAMLGAERAGVSKADRDSATAICSSDPIGAAESLSRCQAFALRQSGSRQAALDESTAARRWLTYLFSLAGEKGWKSDSLPFLEEWLGCIEQGPVAGGRWTAVVTGLAAWGSLARRVESVMQEGDRT